MLLYLVNMLNSMLLINDFGVLDLIFLMKKEDSGILKKVESFSFNMVICLGK